MSTHKATVVVNSKTLPYPKPDEIVYIGRPSKWGNPFILGIHGDRQTVIKKYRQWLMGQARLLSQLHELRGKTLVCFCKPFACHGDILAELADALPDTRQD